MYTHSFLSALFLDSQYARHSARAWRHPGRRKGIPAKEAALQEHRAERQVPDSHLPDPYQPHPCVTRSYQVISLPVSRLHPQLCKPAATTLGHHVSTVPPTGHLAFHPAPSLICVLYITNEVLEYQAHDEWTCLISCHLLLPTVVHCRW